jgi:hypothetical protein
MLITCVTKCQSKQEKCYKLTMINVTRAKNGLLGYFISNTSFKQ